MARPNFVFIMTDTQGANMVGCYGQPGLRTPNLDRMAAEGTRYDRAYTTQPVCTPARAGIFTGSYPHSTGAWGNHLPVGDTLKTMGQRFTDAGYHSAYIGKWHLSGHDYFDDGICPPGWDPEYWYDGKRYVDELTDEEVALWRNGLGSVELLRKHGINKEFTWAHRNSNRAIDFLEKAKGKDEPFLLVVSHDEPHGPCVCPPEYVEQFQDFEYEIGPNAHDDLADKPAHHREWAEAANCRRESGRFSSPKYFGCNSFVDAEIGRVIDAVDRLAPDNTYIIYTSDHGDMFGAHGLNSKGPCMYDEIACIPLIIRKPAKADAGIVDDALVSHVDLLPTMLELAGMEVPPILDGRSLVPRLKGDKEADERKILVEFNRYEVCHDYTGFQPIRCWMAGDFKLVINLLEDKDELYDMKKDPAEMKNLIEDPAHKEIRDRMHDELLDHIFEGRDPFRGPHWERRPWRTTRRFGWKGMWRPRPEDGYAPPICDYRTAKPHTGARKN